MIFLSPTASSNNIFVRRNLVSLVSCLCWPVVLFVVLNHDYSTGVAAGSKHNEHGGGSNVICIDLNVSYTPGKYRDGNQGETFNIGVLDCHTYILTIYCLYTVYS